MPTDHRNRLETHGLRIVRANNLDTNTAQTAGMTRAEAIPSSAAA
jgi:hypothetical protein